MEHVHKVVSNFEMEDKNLKEKSEKYGVHLYSGSQS